MEQEFLGPISQSVVIFYAYREIKWTIFDNFSIHSKFQGPEKQVGGPKFGHVWLKPIHIYNKQNIAELLGPE